MASIGTQDREQDRARRLDNESALWAALAGATDASSFCRAWLDMQCARTPGILSGLVLLQGDAGTFAPAAIYPAEPQGLDHLRNIAERALTEVRAVVESDPDFPGQTGIAYPIEAQRHVHGAVMLLVTGASPQDLQAIVRELHWGVGWILAMVWQHRADATIAQAGASASALDVLAAVEEQESLEEASLALCNSLALALDADRVSFGLVRDEAVKLHASSHGAWFRKRSDVTEALEAAMEEALDRGEALVFPAREGSTAINLQQSRLASFSGDAAIATVPAIDRGRAIGLITLERGAEALPFGADDITFVEGVAGLVAPLLELKARENRWLGGRLRRYLVATLTALFGPRRPFAKLLGVLALVLLVILLIPLWQFRIGADAALEGRVQRTAAAPFSGYISQSFARAGDSVKQGQLLARLDDRDLKLDEAKSRSEVQRFDRQYREALAKHERSDMNLFGAQLRQSQAQLSLIEYKLKRTDIVAPIGGVIVSGDVSQLVGTPVKEGDVMFQIAPLDGFRLVLQVEETDVPYLRIGQRGRFAPAGLAGDTVDFSVTKITSVTESEDGKNTFRVEAEVDPDSSPILRPGMEGVAKVAIDRRAKLWVWTRGLRNWVRLFLWKWLP